MPEHSFEKIDYRKSEEYKARQKEQREYSASKHEKTGIFCGELLKKYFEAYGSGEPESGKEPKLHEIRKNIVLRWKKAFEITPMPEKLDWSETNKAKTWRLYSPVSRFILESLQDSDQYQLWAKVPALKDAFEGQPQEDFSMEVLATRIAYYLSRDPKIDDFKRGPELMALLPEDLVIKATETHRDNFLRKKEEFEIEIDLVKNIVAEKLEQAREDGIIITRQDVLKEVMDETQIRVSDPLGARLWGSYSAKEAAVKSAYLPDRQQLTSVLTHEYLHALAGKTVGVFHYDEGKYSVAFQRLGLQFSLGYKDEKEDEQGLKEKKVSMARFWWLNEAVTDLLMEKVAGGEAVYKNEIKLTQFLLNGLGENGFDYLKRAYFENYRTGLAVGERMPYWKLFSELVADRFGKRFLVRLDEYIRWNSGKHANEGVRAALDKIEEMGEKFVDFINEWKKPQ